MQHNTTKPFSTQRESRADAYKRIESILEKAGSAGVHRSYFLYTLHWSQHGARITEMNDLGWVIESVPLPESQWVHGVRTKYVLRSKPLAPGEDWYVQKTGHARPSAHPWKEAFSPKRLAQPDCLTEKQPSLFP